MALAARGRLPNFLAMFALVFLAVKFEIVNVAQMSAT